MVNKKTVCMGALTILLIILQIVSQAFLIIQVRSLQESIYALEQKAETFEKHFAEYQEHEEQLFEKIYEQLSALFAKQEANKTEIQKDLVVIKQKSDAQFSKTVDMSRTYNAILEEQKKKTVNIAEKDSAFFQEKQHAITSYKNGNYADAYEAFRKLSAIYEEDMECRLYKAKSLYYINRADNSNYFEILEDIKILKQNAATDNECLEIEKAIRAEKEGISE